MSAESDPSGYCVNCPNCGRVHMSCREYRKQVNDNDVRWFCPLCGIVGFFEVSRFNPPSPTPDAVPPKLTAQERLVLAGDNLRAKEGELKVLREELAEAKVARLFELVEFVDALYLDEFELLQEAVKRRIALESDKVALTELPF